MHQKTAYGIYLIPEPALGEHLSQIHTTLRTNFGLEAAAKFMPHCTITAFLYLQEDKTLADLINAIDPLLSTFKPVPLEFDIFYKTEQFIGAGFNNKNEAMQELFSGLLSALQNIITETNYQERSNNGLKPHFTFAFRDLPQDKGLYDQIAAYCEHFYSQLPLTSNPYTRYFQLIKFETSAENGFQDKNNYWRTLRWQLLKGWTL
jgi:2'-5' RNA ligase